MSPRPQGCKVPSDLHAPKTMFDSEGANTPLCPTSVLQVLNLPFGTKFDSFGNQYVHNVFVSMAHARNDVDRPQDIVTLKELHKSDKFALKVSPNQSALVQKGTELLLDLGSFLSVVVELPALFNRRLAIDRLDASREIIIQLHYSQVDAALETLTKFISRLVTNIIPPFVVGRYRQNGQTCVLSVVRIVEGRLVTHVVNKREEIRLEPSRPHFLNRLRRVIQKIAPFMAEFRDSEDASGNRNFLTEDKGIHSLISCFSKSGRSELPCAGKILRPRG